MSHQQMFLGRKPAPVGTIIMADDFNDNSLDTAKWQIVGGTVSETNNRLEISGASTGNLFTLNQFDFRAKSIEVEMFNLTPEVYTVLFLAENTSFSRFIGMDFLAAGNIRGYQYDGTNFPRDFEIPYVAATHRFVKMSFTATTITYYTSADGVSWTTRASASLLTTIPINAMYCGLRFFSPTTGTTKSAWDNFKIIG